MVYIFVCDNSQLSTLFFKTMISKLFESLLSSPFLGITFFSFGKKNGILKSKTQQKK